MNAETRAAIKTNAVSIWLKADVATLVERVGRRSNRPLLAKGNPAEILEKLARDRNPVYAEADFSVESGKGPHDDVVAQIIKTLKQRGLAGS